MWVETEIIKKEDNAFERYPLFCVVDFLHAFDFQLNSEKCGRVLTALPELLR